MTESLFSIIVPVYISATNLQVLAERVSRAIDAARLHFELILEDDGSQDGSFAEIIRLSHFCQDKAALGITGY